MPEGAVVLNPSSNVSAHTTAGASGTPAARMPMPPAIARADGAIASGTCSAASGVGASVAVGEGVGVGSGSGADSVGDGVGDGDGSTGASVCDGSGSGDSDAGDSGGAVCSGTDADGDGEGVGVAAPAADGARMPSVRATTTAQATLRARECARARRDSMGHPDDRRGEAAEPARSAS